MRLVDTAHGLPASDAAPARHGSDHLEQPVRRATLRTCESVARNREDFGERLWAASFGSRPQAGLTVDGAKDRVI